MPTIDEFGAAERWKLQPKPIRQQTLKHTSSTGFAGEHGNVIAAAWISILAILAATMAIWLKDRQKSKSLKN